MENSKTLIDAVKSRDVASIESLLASGADVNSTDEQGWTPLSHAAGIGDLELVRVLVENGADVFKAGRDNRNPYLIALAAGRVDVVKCLREVQDEVDPERAESLRLRRKYCKAYYLGQLRKFPAWSESRINWRENKLEAGKTGGPGEFADDDIVYLHEDLSVTDSMWHDENVIFRQATHEWRDFCSTELEFEVPDDLDLIPSQVSPS